MKISYKSIIVLAAISLTLAIATLYLDSFDVNNVQNNSSSQFQVGVTVRPKNPTAFQRMQQAWVRWFR